MRTLPPCVLESVIVMPFTARLKVFCGVAITKSDFCEELLFAFDDEEDFAEDEDFADDEVSALLDELFSDEEDFASLEEDSCFAEELLETTLDELCFSEELEGGATELEDSSFEELDDFSELLLGACDELDSTDDDETDEDDSALELLGCELLDSPYLE